MLTCYFEDSDQPVHLRHVSVASVVVHDHQILMIQRASHLTEPNKYGLPGGYLDRDETTTQGAAREILEETGYETKSLQLFRINDNPYRIKEDRQNLEFVFIGEVGNKVSEPDHEIQAVKWFNLDHLPDPTEIAFDHLENIQLFQQYQREKFRLPIFESK